MSDLELKMFNHRKLLERMRDVGGANINPSINLFKEAEKEIAELRKLAGNALLEATNTVIKQDASIQELAEALKDSGVKHKIGRFVDRHEADKIIALANKHLKGE